MRETFEATSDQTTITGISVVVLVVSVLLVHAPLHADGNMGSLGATGRGRSRLTHRRHVYASGIAIDGWATG